MIARQIYSAFSVALIILIHCYGKSSIQEDDEKEEEEEEEEEGGGGGGEEEEEEEEEEDTLHRHTGLKFKGEKTSTLLHWEKSFVWC